MGLVLWTTYSTSFSSFLPLLAKMFLPAAAKSSMGMSSPPSPMMKFLTGTLTPVLYRADFRSWKAMPPWVPCMTTLSTTPMLSTSAAASTKASLGKGLMYLSFNSPIFSPSPLRRSTALLAAVVMLPMVTRRLSASSQRYFSTRPP